MDLLVLSLALNRQRTDMHRCEHRDSRIATRSPQDAESSRITSRIAVAQRAPLNQTLASGPTLRLQQHLPDCSHNMWLKNAALRSPYRASQQFSQTTFNHCEFFRCSSFARFDFNRATRLTNAARAAAPQGRSPRWICVMIA